MKPALLVICILFFHASQAQDNLKVKHIDSLVSGIKSSALPVRRDSLVQNRPEIGFKMTTYLTSIENGGELLKYEQLVHSSFEGDGAPKIMTASSAFYYQHNQLIKVEEHLTDETGNHNVEWYYSDDKPLYSTLDSLKSDAVTSRANMLLSMGKGMVKLVVK